MAKDSITVNLIGHKDVVAAFKELQTDLPSTWLRNSVKTAATLLESFIVSLAPRRTGKLIRNINVRTHETAHTIRARVTVNTVGKGDDPQNAFYWRFLEKGWRDRGGKFHQLPFIEPAFSDHEEEAAQAVIDSVEAAIDKAEMRAAGRSVS